MAKFIELGRNVVNASCIDMVSCTIEQLSYHNDGKDPFWRYMVKVSGEWQYFQFDEKSECEKELKSLLEDLGITYRKGFKVKVRA